MKRLLLLCVALVALLAIPASASADGDPGSDVLYFQTLFVGAQDNVSVAQQTQLSTLLEATKALNAQVRVAIIGQRRDLGYYTSLWEKPAVYADVLGTELQLEYAGRLIVVMPDGVAFYWDKHGVSTLTSARIGTNPTQLVNAAVAGVTKVEAAAGISARRLRETEDSPSLQSAAVANAHQTANGAIATSGASAAGTEPTASASATNVSPVIIVVGLLVVLSAVFWVPPVWRRRGVLKQGGIALPGLGFGIGALGVLVVLAVIVHSDSSSTASADALATNPDIGPVTALGHRPAPTVSLTDEVGQHVNLEQYRGKVVILSFTDAECQTICPLTTQAMVDARDSLGAAKRDVQLIGVDINPDSTTIQDVDSYTQLHGLLGQWHFLTGSLPQLEKVWREYHVASDVSTNSNIIDHTPELFIIDPDGRVRYTATTVASYSAIPQFGQEIAGEVAGLLPSHPKVQTSYSYTPVKGITPSERTTLPTVGGGSVTLGTGAPHLYLFFASWDTQSTPIKARMEQLNTYALQAKRLGLPPLTAIDEAQVEPNATAVHTFLAGMHLDYPVAIDTTGQVADGYSVEGEPWFVLAVPGAKDTVQSPTAQIPWYQEVYTQGWPTLKNLDAEVSAALKPAPASPVVESLKRDLAGSPPALAKLHAQASEILAGGGAALEARIKALRGHPIVVNVWGSWCPPCQKEFPFFATASAVYGKKVAFLGADYDEPTTSGPLQFLAAHHVSYPSYGIGEAGFPTALLPGGVQNTPTTIFIAPNGQVSYTRPGEYASEQQLAQDVQAYAVGSG